MNQLRTISRTSNWTPDRLRILSAIVVSAEHVSDAALGRVEGVVLDDAGKVHSFIVRLWDGGIAGNAVQLPLACVRWYTEGVAPVLGIDWAPQTLRSQPALARGGPRTPSLTVPPRSTASFNTVDAAPRRRSAKPSVLGALTAAGVGAIAGGLLLQDWILAATLALLAAPLGADLFVRNAAARDARPRRPAGPPNAAPPAKAALPWLGPLEQDLASPQTFERRVLHFSLLNQPAARRAPSQAA